MRRTFFLCPFLSACLFASCSESNGGVVPPAQFDFFVQSSDLTPTLKLNQPITFEFSLPVDFSTVGPNTIRIQSSAGVPATGTYSFARRDMDGDGIPEVDTRSIVFRPSCPTRADGSDAGFEAGASYQLEIPGGGVTLPALLLAETGQALFQTFAASFDAADGDDPADLFVDTKIGPPLPLIRAVGSADPINTHAEIGGDSGRRVYFEFDSSTGTVITQPADFLAPLNLYSDPNQRVEFSIWFDQPIDPSLSNIARIGVQYLGSDERFHDMDVRVELLSNCSDVAGALVRVVPSGVFPASGQVRLNIAGGFRDIVGNPWLNQFNGFAQLQTVAVDFANLIPPDALGDEAFASFDHGTPSRFSLQDPEPVLDAAEAEWGQGVLRSSNGFEGTGGPAGEFDWHVRTGELVFFDTTQTLIVGGADGIPQSRLFVVGGKLSLRNVVIEDGATVRVVGPNPFSIEATGSVEIDGLLDLSGFNGRDVIAFNTGHQPEPGAAGAGGGGAGGTASQETTTSTARGGAGEGPFARGSFPVDPFAPSSTGATGGESSFAPRRLGKDARRPGGGGGGRFALDEGDLSATSGVQGHPSGKGAESGMSPAMGGVPNASPFEDGRRENDFYGIAPKLDGDGRLIGTIRGELEHPSAGHGGGAGGDAIPSSVFPAPNWHPGSDEKGGPGGGAGGLLHVRALGPIVLGPSGEIRSNGGRGGVGENTLFLDHIGGSGGSASGGHVILESASYVDLQPATSFFGGINAVGGPLVIGPAADIPLGISHGGAGGPGVIQIHVPEPERGVGASPDEAGVVLSPQALGEGDPLDAVTTPRAKLLYPSLGSRSLARSRWISLGAADQGRDGHPDLVTFLFLGTNQNPGPDEGTVRTKGTEVVELEDFFGGGVVDDTNATIGPDDVTLVLRGDALAFGSPDMLFVDAYLRTPALLENFGLRLFTNSNLRQEFVVSQASFDDENFVLSVRIEFTGTTLSDFVELADGPVHYALIPRYFRLRTPLGQDRLPEGAQVRILFQGAAAADGGGPDVDNPLVNWTGDISRFNELDPGLLGFFRFQVEFLMPRNGPLFDPDTQGIEMDFLRVPFRF